MFGKPEVIISLKVLTFESITVKYFVIFSIIRKEL